MLSFHINLTSLAVILWSGMLIIAGSIWVLSSQVRKLADLLEARSSSGPWTTAEARPSATARRPRSATTRGSSAPARRSARAASGAR